MRIALVSIGDPRDVKVWSGTPSFILRELRKQTSAVEVIAPLSRWFKYLFMPARILHRIRRTQIQFDRHPLALRSYARQIQRQLRGKQVDAVLSTSSVAVSLLKTRIPIFFWTDAVVEGMFDYYPGSFTGMATEERVIGHRQEQNALDRCTGAFYSSNWAAQMARDEYSGTQGKVDVVEFGANLEIDHSHSIIESLIESRMKRPVNLLFVGVDWVRKGGPVALEATRILNERGMPAVLRVVGCTAPDSPFVENLGFISKATPEGVKRMNALYSEATFFMFPTRAEASAIVFAEASSFGLPMLSTDTGGVRNYVRDGENGFLFGLAEQGIKYADAIDCTFRDSSLYRRLSMGAFKYYEQNLNWHVAIAKILRTIEAKCGERRL